MARPLPQPHRPPPAVVSVREAAALLGTSSSCLYEALRDGTTDVRCIRVGSRVVVAKAELERLGVLPPAAKGGKP